MTSSFQVIVAFVEVGRIPLCGLNKLGKKSHLMSIIL